MLCDINFNLITVKSQTMDSSFFSNGAPSSVSFSLSVFLRRMRLVYTVEYKLAISRFRAHLTREIISELLLRLNLVAAVFSMGVARIFSEGCTFFLKKLTTLLVVVQ